VKITLVPAEPAHAKFLYDHRLDPVTRNFQWLVRCDGELVGNVSLQGINRSMLTGEIGYGVAATARGRGISTSAIKELTKRIFAQTPLRKLIAYVHEDNAPSRKALARVGYREEGLLREHYLINGKPVNEIIYGILKHEFSA
jgi:[ribosomal protein S5]-alanine N-acetyltransferase